MAVVEKAEDTPVPETPLDHWLAKWQLHYRHSDEEVEMATAELRQLVRTAQAEAAERGFREGWRLACVAEGTTGEILMRQSKAWAASRLKAELEQPSTERGI